MKKKIAVIAFSELHRDARLLRHLQALKEDYAITAFGFSDPRIPDVSFCAIPANPRPSHQKALSAALLLTRQFERHYWSCPKVQALLQKLSPDSFDLIFANDIETLPAALSRAGSAKVLYDAHEYAPRQFEDRPLWRLFYQKYKTYLCHTYLKQADAMFTVSEGLRDEYRRLFGVTPQLLSNAAPYWDLSPSPVAPNRIRIISHGAAIPSRKLENQIALMDHLDDRFTLDLVLLPTDKHYHAKLKKLAAKNPKVRMLEPLPQEQIVPFLSKYDIGLFLLEPTNFNYRNALPNKLFDFIQARLAIAIGPSPSMQAIVAKYDLGIVSKDFTPKSMADRLNSLSTNRLNAYKTNTDNVAGGLSDKKNRRLLTRTVRELLATSLT